jgi:hypothetical protein
MTLMSLHVELIMGCDDAADGNTVHWLVLFMGTTNIKSHTHGILCAFGKDFVYRQKFEICHKTFNFSLLIVTMWFYPLYIKCLSNLRGEDKTFSKNSLRF